MTRDETKTLIIIIARFYSERLLPLIDSDYINAWHDMLSDIDINLAAAAVKAWVQTEKYPPAVSDIREKCITKPTTDSALEAWGKINQAVRKFGYYNQADLLDSLGDTALRRIVDQFTVRHFCLRLEANEATDYAQFRDAYNAEVKKESYRAQISAPVRAMLDGGKLGLEAGNE